jgi:hypothetical protein
MRGFIGYVGGQKAISEYMACFPENPPSAFFREATF